MFESYADNFIRKSIGNYERAVPLAGDASSRRYYRVFKNSKSYILCEDGQFKNVPEKDYPYLIVYDIFRRENIPVPEVYFRETCDGLLLIEDLGDELLESFYAGIPPEKRREIYTALIDILIKIQLIRRVDELPPFKLSFDVEKLMFEFNFFIENALLGYFKIKTGDERIEELSAEFLKISNILYRPDIFILNHRDFHSRNVLIFNRKPYLIDFQDARMGLPQYDAASFLRDSYLNLDNDSFRFLYGYYYARSADSGVHKMDKDEFEYFFDIM
ncbi:MAG: phosphotransferase, partial [Spirochaetes bacterium]|nr:phosphotransferase [Spirochaetota bacterium]